MKNKLNIITVCVTAIAFCAPLAVSAKTKTSASATPAASASPAASAAAKTAAPAASPAAKMARAIPFRGMIATADQSAKTFTITGKEKSRVFKITDKTIISKAGVAATMKDVAANMEVRGSYWKMADGSLEAKTVKLGPKTEAEMAASAKKSASSKKKKSETSAASTTASPAASPASSASPKP